MKYRFSKYHGSGNDFLLIDDRSLSFPAEDAGRIQTLCHRRFGIGADGLVLCQPSKRAALRMRIFNCDGKEAEMCGNAIRCLTHFARRLKLGEDRCNIETTQCILTCRFVGELIAVEMGIPKLLGRHEEAILLHTGVPHAVVFVPEVAAVDVAHLGAALRKKFDANVNFAAVKGEQIHLRTFERGVEGETLSCGTGAVAVAAAARLCLGWQGKVRLLPAARQELVVQWQGELAELIGPVAHVFDGEIG